MFGDALMVLRALIGVSMLSRGSGNSSLFLSLSLLVPLIPPPFVLQGTGKTLAYLLPLLARVDNYKKTTQAIIMVPTRELVRVSYFFPSSREITT